jgi:hypothetical protein
MKKDNRENITTIIHDIKTSYSKVFHEKFPMDDKKMEEILISVARKAKRGYHVQWYLDELNNKKVRFL